MSKFFMIFFYKGIAFTLFFHITYIGKFQICISVPLLKKKISMQIKNYLCVMIVLYIRWLQKYYFWCLIYIAELKIDIRIIFYLVVGCIPVLNNAVSRKNINKGTAAFL